jgi:hypothetical protein
MTTYRSLLDPPEPLAFERLTAPPPVPTRAKVPPPTIGKFSTNDDVDDAWFSHQEDFTLDVAPDRVFAPPPYVLAGVATTGLGLVAGLTTIAVGLFFALFG